MGKNIAILNGSPRKNGNTSALVKAFTEGAKKSGNNVTEFFLDCMNIHGCKGCFGGHSSEDHATSSLEKSRSCACRRKQKYRRN